MRRHRHHRGRRTPRRSASSTEWMSHQGAPSTGPASISSTPSPTPSCAPSSRSSPPRPAPARRPSAPGGGPSGAQLPSTSSPTVTSPARSVSASSTSRFSKILAEHSGPALRLSLPCIRRRYHGRIEGWLRSQALTDLQELHFGYGDDEILSRPPLPPSALRFAPTLRVASFSCCHFPDLSSQSLNFPHLSQLSLDKVTISDAVASLNFPCLKQLTMYDVAISGDALNSLLIGCLSLESLLMYLKFAIACLRISSPTLRSISFSAPYTKGLFQELVIEDAPCLERLLPLNPDYGPASVRVIHAPKLQVLGLLSKGISKLHIGATVFQEMTATSVITTMRSVKVLVIEIVGPNLGAVLGFLKCFPCLERLYVVSLLRMETKNVRNMTQWIQSNALSFISKEWCCRSTLAIGQMLTSPNFSF